MLWLRPWQCPRRKKVRNQPWKCRIDDFGWTWDVSKLLHWCSWPHNARSHAKSRDLWRKSRNILGRILINTSRYWRKVMCADRSCMFQNVSTSRKISYSTTFRKFAIKSAPKRLEHLLKGFTFSNFILALCGRRVLKDEEGCVTLPPSIAL